MKNYHSPLNAARAQQRFVKLTRIRVALLLALVAALSCLPFYVFAQDKAAPVKVRPSSTYRLAPDTSAFIISQGPNGESVCRQVTASEAQALKSGSVKQELRQINHLKDSSEQVETTTGLTIVLRATAQLDGNPTAKQAFINAAAKWESLIRDPITIIIDVDFGSTFFGTPFNNPQILGATQPQLLGAFGNYPDLRTRLINHATGSEGTLYNALPTGSVPTDIGNIDTVFVSSPLLRVFGILPSVATDSEPGIGSPPKIGFNSAFGWDFDPSNGISSTLTDFDAVAVHEMGHVLGFNSGVGERELEPTDPLALSIWDFFRFRPGTVNLGNFNTAQRILHSGGEQRHFSGGPELALSTGRPDGTGGDGEQASHWKDDDPPNLFIGIMDPTIRRGERETMTEADENAIDAFGYTITATVGPPNDNFANAQLISGSSGTANGTNAFATREAGEPTNPIDTGGGRSVWYNWTAPGTGQATFDTIGSDYDTTLAIYTGSAVNALTHIASNDDIVLGMDVQSRVMFNANAGTTYRIQVDGFDAAQGTIVLHWTAPGAPTPTPTPTPGPNTVQFTQSLASANETDANSLDLTVTRTGNVAAAATVNYATSNASANDRSDYETALGTLFFAAGETSKTIPLFMINDTKGETDETFNINFSAPVSCTLGSPAAVQVTIHSDESVDGSNPVKDGSFNNTFFVRQHYLDFFNRVPDAPGLAFWKNQLDECENVPLPGGFANAQQCREIRRINVSAAFFLSTEFQQTGYLVERLYKSAYGNATGTSTFGGTHQLPVPIVRFSELLADTHQIGRGVIIGNPGADQLLENNKQTLIAQFVERARFVAEYPVVMTPAQFVDKLNLNSGGALSPGERDQLVAELGSGAKSRAQVLRAVAEDSTLFAAETNRAFVLAQFIGYLRRNPNDAPEAGLDYTGYDFWLGKLNEFNGNFVNAEMVKAFIISSEYQGRFGP